MEEITAVDVTEIKQRMCSEDPIERSTGLSQAMVLDSKGINIGALFPYATRVPGLIKEQHIQSTRFVGILAESCMDYDQDSRELVIQNILAEFESPDPIRKGIAVRQAGRLVDDNTVEKLIPIIAKGSSCDDPYVRKAAALAILQVHKFRPSFVDSYKLAGNLKTLIEDSNPNVAANAVSALSEINFERTSPVFTLQSVETVNNILSAIDQSTEWAQSQILDFVATFTPKDESEARGIIARVSSRLSHANPAVVFSAIRCCLKMNVYIKDAAKVQETIAKIVLPLITLLNSSYSIEYTAVESILVLLQSYKRLLSSEVSIFFCKFDDPVYMKLAKLDVILALATTQNVGKVIDELFDYAQQTDVTFVRKSIQCIGKLAVNFENAADTCVDRIVSLLELRVHFVVQECIIVTVDIFRRYPGKYEGIISKICTNLVGSLDDHRAKCAMVWILGEYSSMISNAGSLIEALFLDDFSEDTADVQMAILTAVVKFYLSSPEEGQPMLQRLISQTTEESDDPSVRDRAYEYYWMLTECPNVAGDIICCEKPTRLSIPLIETDPEKRLVPEIGTLAVLYKQLPEKFVFSPKAMILNLDEPEKNAGIDQMDLPVLTTEEGIEVKGSLTRIGENNQIALRLTNTGETSINVERIIFNRNVFGFSPGESSTFPAEIGRQQTVTVGIPIVYSADLQEGATPSEMIDVAIKVDRPQPIFFKVSPSLDAYLLSDGKMSQKEFVDVWGSMPEDDGAITVENSRIDTIDVAKHALKDNRLFFVAKKGNCAYFSGKTIQGLPLIAYISFEDGSKCTIGIRMSDRRAATVILQKIRNLMV